METHQLPVTLYNKYRPLFREVVFRPGYLDLQKGRLMLTPYFACDQSILLPGLHPIPYFDFIRGSMPVEMRFDPSNREDFTEQVTSQTFNAIMDGPLRGRRFFFDVWVRDEDKEGEDIFWHGYVKFVYSFEGQPIPGLYLNEERKRGVFFEAGGWKKLIPSSLHLKAIEAALELKHAEETPETTTIKYLAYVKSRLEAALKAIPA